MEARKERLVSASAKEERKKKEESLPALELYSLCKLYLEQSQNKDIFGQTKKNEKLHYQVLIKGNKSIHCRRTSDGIRKIPEQR